MYAARGGRGDGVKANRRGFFGILAVVGTATAVSAQPTAKPERTLIEYSDAQKGHRASILLDGVDISSKCFRAERWSDGNDLAWCYNFEETKRTHVLSHMVLRGKVDIIPQAVAHDNRVTVDIRTDGATQQEVAGRVAAYLKSTSPHSI